MPTDLDQILRSIELIPQKFFQRLVGIDGLGASGKTTIVDGIKRLHAEISIIRLEDFYLPKMNRTTGILENHVVSPDFDWDRLEGQVFDAVRRNLLVKYQKYLWREDRWGGWIEIPATSWIIVVGVYALQSRFFSAYDYTIWVETPRGERIRRMIEREGESVAKEWQEKWLPREERYFELDHPDKRAASTIFANTSG